MSIQPFKNMRFFYYFTNIESKVNWVETTSGENKWFLLPSFFAFLPLVSNEHEATLPPVPRDWHTNMMKVWQPPATICLIRYPNAQQYVLLSAQLPPWRSLYYSLFPCAYVGSVLLGLSLEIRTSCWSRKVRWHELGDASWSLPPQDRTFSSQGCPWLTQKVLPTRLSSASPKIYSGDTRFP